MKFEECKVGDVVYLMTELRILDHENIKRPSIIPKRFMIIDKREYSKTVEIKSLDMPSVKPFDYVLPSCLEKKETLISKDKFSMSDALHGKVITRPQTSDYKLDFEVRREKNELSAYYHGIKLATVRCHPDDTYDEEFGLHLLLRRACLKLKDEHTVVETVEELLEGE